MSRTLRDVPARADLLLPALEAALDGSGPAVSPVGPHTHAAGSDRDVPDGTALVVRTSGSTGEPREVVLAADALRASGTATERRLAGAGRWLLALPAEHVAGAQVLVRSVLAGTTPVVLPDGPFRAPTFTAAVAALTHDGPRYTSLVPTQLVRLLDDAAATDALRGLDAVLVGGAASAPDLLVRARAAGVPVVTTYGMSETCGGCVYDGVPLDGVVPRLDADGRILLAGPVLATGYLGRPDLDATAFAQVHGVRHLVTNDLGRLDGGVLTVLGRADDVILTGATNVAPATVEALLAALPGVAEACVVGVPDDEWGQLVVGVVVPRAGSAAPDLDAVRAVVAERLGTAHAPRRLVVVDSLPLRGPGKIDRRAVAALAAAATDSSVTNDRRVGAPPAAGPERSPA
ncbi:o-succinylbenzoate--CoA ligase [Cellulomonas alba]|uniref:O-succinylbenzoate--CoA ligase n=1 Tax=Cellulomonas alba TaxID=3053467 RepID=A0ABT7SDY8_9CELL|nr:o-succinylbenzoate--CoA ligase [Cellulomonas alba]MDM7854411.1 o-succinylbenzoate--CoA ligase [Cellulomonas alba]